jgi:hypothetical protein
MRLKSLVFVTTLLLLLTYFTNRTIVRRFFPSPALKWVMVVLCSLTIVTYVIASLLRAKRVTANEPTD